MYIHIYNFILTILFTFREKLETSESKMKYIVLLETVTFPSGLLPHSWKAAVGLQVQPFAPTSWQPWSYRDLRKSRTECGRIRSSKRRRSGNRAARTRLRVRARGCLAPRCRILYRGLLSHRDTDEGPLVGVRSRKEINEGRGKKNRNYSYLKIPMLSNTRVRRRVIIRN